MLPHTQMCAWTERLGIVAVGLVGGWVCGEVGGGGRGGGGAQKNIFSVGP